MGQIYSVAIAGLHAFSGSLTITPSETNTTVIHTIDVFFASLIPGSINICGSEGQTFYWAECPGADGGEQQWTQWRGRHVLGPGSTITIVQAGSPVDVSIAGYSLTP